ncbi:MAG: hypothetical protein ACE14P_12080 [Methanotrichaceae archaeon]
MKNFFGHGIKKLLLEYFESYSDLETSIKEIAEKLEVQIVCLEVQPD